jgi:hypothetical protein
MRRFMTAAALLLLAAPASAQQHDAHHAAGSHHPAGGTFPTGWQGRVDRANQKIEDVQFMAMGETFHAITGAHAILWNPAHTATGAYTLAATFTQTKAPARLEGFGLLAGGRDLDQPGQDYLYFLIRHDGSYMVRHRAGTEVHTLADWTPHAAIRKATATEAASNTLAIESAANEVRFLVNGQAVHAIARVPMLNTNGLVGFRLGHHLDVRIADFAVHAAH